MLHVSLGLEPAVSGHCSQNRMSFVRPRHGKIPTSTFLWRSAEESGWGGRTCPSPSEVNSVYSQLPFCVSPSASRTFKPPGRFSRSSSSTCILLAEWAGAFIIAGPPPLLRQLKQSIYPVLARMDGGCGVHTLLQDNTTDRHIGLQLRNGASAPIFDRFFHSILLFCGHLFNTPDSNFKTVPLCGSELQFASS